MKFKVQKEQKHTLFYLLNFNKDLDFNNKNIWIITDGSQGMISQANGLAQQFGNKIFNIKTELIFPWSILQPGYLPI